MVTGGNAPFTYAWNFGGGAANASVEDPGDVTFSQKGVYVVIFEVIDEDGDSDSATVTVTPGDNPALAIIRKARQAGTRVLTISPGGDGSDTFSDEHIRIRPGTDLSCRTGPDRVRPGARFSSSEGASC